MTGGWGHLQTRIYNSVNHNIKQEDEFEFVTDAAVRQLDLLRRVAAELPPSTPQALRLRKSDAER